jgi:8-oxo-dGTP pyrophosphatase MutT (NUDIX family)
MEWHEEFRGTIFSIQRAVHKSGKLFEIAVRSPGVRLIIADRQGRVLLNREKRRELEYEIDCRLPGGMVFDEIDEFLKVRGTSMLDEHVMRAAVKEAEEEVGVIISEGGARIWANDNNFGKVEFDLFFVEVNNFKQSKIGPVFADTESEEIMGWRWYTFDEAAQSALDPLQFSEGRSARMLLSYIHTSGQLL